MNAYTYPDFYRQLGHDPEQITGPGGVPILRDCEFFAWRRIDAGI
jgi:hypothetical protein